MNHGWPLVGRAGELQRIADAIRRRDGCTGLVISGDAGVGKTRLVREALAKSRRPSRWVAASASAQSIPLGALARWAPKDSPDPVDLVHDVLGALIGTRSNHRRVVVAVDDAHLLDDMSVFVVHQLVARQLASVILTVRSGEPVPDTITSMWADGDLGRFDLEPLSSADSVALVEATLGGPLDSFGAQQLWRLTKGNVLYLRHIVEQELAERRLGKINGTWVWTGDLVVSRTLTELVASRIGRLPKDVAEVVDLLAVAEPLSVTTLLELVDADALESSEARRLTIVDSTVDDEPLMRLAHPLYGEARKATAGAMRLRRLRGLVASRLSKSADEDMRAMLRRAVLILDSDLESDPAEMLRAAAVAMSLTDNPLAVRLSQVAVRSGGGWPAELAHATYVLAAGDIDAAVSKLAALGVREVPEPVRVQADFLRTWALHAGGRPVDAHAALDEAALRHTGATEKATFAALAALTAASRADVHTAVEAADAAFACPDIPDLASMLALVSKIIGLGELGRSDHLGALFEQAHELGETSTSTSAQLMCVAEFYSWAQRLAGSLGESARAIDSVRRYAEGAVGQRWIALMIGCTELAEGRADTAVRRIESVGVTPERPFILFGWLYRYHIDLVVAYAISGDATMAERTLRQVEVLQHSAFEFLTPQRILAQAWLHAAQGWVSGAVAEARRAADYAAARHQLAQEVVCLQLATQFGDMTTAARLAELATMVDGARAPTAAAHSAALAASDGDGLDAASRQFAAMGDLVAAADAAAHASIAHAAANRLTDARTSTMRSRLLVHDCGKVATPALLATVDAAPLRFTDRQREIIAMAARGMTNREIADRLTVSVRTVEGHLYRAATITNAASRAELAAFLHERRDPDAASDRKPK